ncbi:DUF922 domain-containing protein [uncultured Devosia sp.]|uniref:DUF922 domain-containing protein n=1 Tax=uncultured Devosia sp. TaxID=211434 RepID=UPI0035CC36A3
MTTSPLARRLLLVALVMLMPVLPAAANPVTITRSTLHYDIAGATAPDIADSIHRNMPDATEGFVGSTAYMYRWTYKYRAAADASGTSGCAVHDVRVTIAITTRMPRHSTIRAAPDAVRALWENYAIALKRHEDHHADDFVEIGSRLPAAIAAVITPDCATIEAAANRIGMEFVARAQDDADDYDAATHHGVDEGASFPGL